VTRSVRVLDPGPLTTVQDAGRPGFAHLGVPRSGWLDGPAATLADRLVGNDEGAAVLECVLGGLSFEVSTAMTIAVTGARCPVTVDGRPAAHAAPLSVAAGSVVSLGAATSGVRCYVALAGGVASEAVLGSRSTDTLSKTGPPAVSAGMVLPIGPARGLPAGVEAVPVHAALVPGEPVRLRCTPGPRADWFTSSALGTLAASAYTVSAESDRVGLRLSGPPLARERAGELPSEGMVLGAVQVPADGRPLVFLNDHPTTGGYPVIAVVHPEALWRCAQLRPGDTVRFVLPRGTTGAA
jgi:biotin-dependent carboxylase-like uncharacterized protein